MTHVEIRGPEYRGALKDGAKILFWFSLATGTPARFVLAEAPIDALSLAAIEGIASPTRLSMSKPTTALNHSRA